MFSHAKVLFVLSLLFCAARIDAENTIGSQNARLEFYHERLKCLYNSKSIWKKLKNLGICSSGLNSPSTFTAEELNDYFSSISFNSLAPSIYDFINEIEEQAEQFSLFSFSEVTLNDVHMAIQHFTSRARRHDGIQRV